MKTRKQRQFEKLYGYDVIQDGFSFYKLTNQTMTKASEQEIKDYLFFKPSSPLDHIRDDFVWLAEIFRTWYRQFKIFQAKALANAKSKAYSGRRYYVLPDPNGKYRVVNRGDIKKLQAKGIMSKNVTFKELTNEAIYYTV